MGDTALLAAGPARAFVDIASSDVDVGFIRGGIRIIREIRTLELMADELGDEPANEIIKGSVITLSFNFAELTLENIARAFAEATTLQDDVTATKKAVELRPKVGKSLLSQARKWLFKPIDAATGDVTTDQNKWITAYKASPTAGSIELLYSHEEQRVIPVTLRCYADTSANKYRKLRIGDPTIVDANESGFTF